MSLPKTLLAVCSLCAVSFPFVLLKEAQANEPIGELTVCIKATQPNGWWSRKPENKKFVKEAKRRNLNLQKCAQLTARPDPQEKPVCGESTGEETFKSTSNFRKTVLLEKWIRRAWIWIQDKSNSCQFSFRP